MHSKLHAWANAPNQTCYFMHVLHCCAGATRPGPDAAPGPPSLPLPTLPRPLVRGLPYTPPLRVVGGQGGLPVVENHRPE